MIFLFCICITRLEICKWVLILCNIYLIHCALIFPYLFRSALVFECACFLFIILLFENSCDWIYYPSQRRRFTVESVGNLYFFWQYFYPNNQPLPVLFYFIYTLWIYFTLYCESCQYGVVFMTSSDKSEKWAKWQ